MSELQKCKAVMEDYLSKYEEEKDPGIKAMLIGKAAYWSIEMDIEAFWEDFWKEKREQK